MKIYGLVILVLLIKSSYPILIYIIISSMMISGCAGIFVPAVVVSSTFVIPESNQTKEISKVSNNFVLGVLPPQKLKKGNCGLFLWGLVPGRPLYFFANPDDKIAKMMINDKLVIMERISENNEIVSGLFTSQTYMANKISIKVNVRTDNSNNVVRGVKIKNSVISIKENTGETSVISTVGLFGCRV